jgi:FtsP/CotA-like multicopper oxidase with cupredoxin domain
MLRNFSIILFFISVSANATVILDTLYINSGSLTVVDYTLQTCVFNDSATFNKQNRVFQLNSGDELLLHIINNDAVEHTFTIDGLIESGNVIPAGGSDDFFLNFPADGIYRFYSDRPGGKLLGASSMILVGYENYARYYWNMFEQQDTLTDKIDAGIETTIPLNYMPDIFTVNMKVSSELDSDTLSYIQQMVGDTIVIAVLNSGNMHHNLHFHGYHLTVLSAEKNTHMINWSKDSFPVVKDEVMLLLLVPDQPGMYMMHNHNMITITTNGVYPGGMMSMIEIMP